MRMEQRTYRKGYNMERLQKFIASCGVASRRKAEELIASGKVRVNGRKVTELGVKVDPMKDKVMVDGQLLAVEKPVYYLMNKPKGVITSVTDPQGRETVMDYIKNEKRRIYPIGRLDLHTEGLLLLTNDGALAHELLAPNKHVTKVYRAKISGVASEETIKTFASGITLGDGTKLKPAKLEILAQDKVHDLSQIEIQIQEGKYHQIKRMFGAVGMKVLELDRISMGKLSLPTDLKRGQYQEITRDKIK